MSLQETKQSIWKLRLIGFPLLLTTTVLLLGSAAANLRAARTSESALDKLASKIIGENADGGWMGALCDIAPLPNGLPWVSFQNIYFGLTVVGFAVAVLLLATSRKLSTEVKETKADVRKEKLRDDHRRNSP